MQAAVTVVCWSKRKVSINASGEPNLWLDLGVFRGLSKRVSSDPSPHIPLQQTTDHRFILSCASITAFKLVKPASSSPPHPHPARPVSCLTGYSVELSCQRSRPGDGSVCLFLLKPSRCHPPLNPAPFVCSSVSQPLLLICSVEKCPSYPSREP